MRYLVEFLTSPSGTRVDELVKPNASEREILLALTRNYTQGVASTSVVELLSQIFGSENFAHIMQLNHVKTLIDHGWISQSFGFFKDVTRSNDLLLSLLQCEISLSLNFLRILEDGKLTLDLPAPQAYTEQAHYLKDQFLRIDLYEKMALFSSAPEAKEQISTQIYELENYIKTRINLTKISLKLEQIFKDNTLNEREQLLFLAILRLEYSGAEPNTREPEALLAIFSSDEIEKQSDKTLLEDGSRLLESGLIEYDEVLNTFGAITQNFFIQEEILQEIMHPKNAKQTSKLKLENIIKDHEIFELIEPTTNINDVVLNEKTKELLEQILKQVDRKVLARLNSWGIKSRKGIDAKIIFYGEAGTGKTMSALSLAKSLKKPVLSFDCSKILSKYVGESEQNVRKIFDSYKEICKKSKTEPVLLLNEADQFLSTRTQSGFGSDKMHNQMQNIFLEQIERFEGVLIATTNFLQSLDVAFSRRFDYKIEFKKPDFKGRLAIWRKVLPENANFEDGFSVEKLAEYKLSGAQIVLVMKNTALRVAVKDDGIFTMGDFQASIEREINSAFDEDKRVGFGS